MTLEEKTKKQVVKALKDGAVGVIPTDTVYGLVCSAFNEKAVERMYSVSDRDSDKPFVVALASRADLSRFGIKLGEKTKRVIESVWPGEVSIVMGCHCEHFQYLHRGKNSVAFRLPRDEEFISILRETGPLATTSANSQGMPVSETINEAEKDFEDKIDFYIDGGHKDVVPSTIIKIGEGEEIKLLREGAVEIDIETLNK